MGPRFDHDLTSDIAGHSQDGGAGSRLLSCYTLENPNYCVPDRNEEDDSFEEGKILDF